MNISKIQQVLGFLQNYPDAFDMAHWSLGTLVADKQTAPSCGTVGCLAGWTIALDEGSFNSHFFENPEEITLRAARILGLSHHTAGYLFFAQFWPDEYRDAYSKAQKRGDNKAMVAVTAKRIEHFMEKHE